MTGVSDTKLEEMFAQFFECNALCLDAASSIKRGREIQIMLAGTNGTVELIFTHEGAENRIRPGISKSPDFTFHFPTKVAKDLVDKPFTSVAEIGIFLFEHIFSSDPETKLRVQLHIGLLSLASGGYFGVLSAGGTDVMKVLAKHGFGSLGKIKDALGKLRG